MKELREGAIKQILNYLDQGVVSKHNFEATFNGSDGVLVSITFRDEPQYFFKLLHPSSSVNESTQWTTVESPGQYFTSEETYENREFPQAFSRASSWVSRLIEDLAVSKAEGKTWIKELRANLEAAADALPNADKPFSEAEMEDWDKKFAGLIERLKKLEEENQIQKGQVDHLKNQLERLKAEGLKIPRRTWLKAAGHKILDVFEHGAKAGVKALAEGAVKAMLEHIK